MGRFTVRLDIPDLAWDLLATLEPMLRSARDATHYGIEIDDAGGTLEVASTMQAKAATAGREHAPARVTATVRGGTDADDLRISPDQRRLGGLKMRSTMRVRSSPGRNLRN